MSAVWRCCWLRAKSSRRVNFGLSILDPCKPEQLRLAGRAKVAVAARGRHMRHSDGQQRVQPSRLGTEGSTAHSSRALYLHADTALEALPPVQFHLAARPDEPTQEEQAEP